MAHERSLLLFVARVTHVYAAFSRIQVEKDRASLDQHIRSLGHHDRQVISFCVCDQVVCHSVARQPFCVLLLIE